ncbi:MAG: Asp-tRNA(Asn)/Glu-tRNA(Gln) amidotransferase subunit GatA [Candidatus Levybacteria bacterium]|nr:Asp-tRNA(Asn)/Glu-tRNA(Gln) amidotransferase subunit GatA [Candidatus Levybacteria bacterium]
MNNFTNLTIKTAREKLDKKEFSSVELTKYYLEQIKKHNDRLNAFITITEHEALTMAEKADEKIHNGESTPLLGIPLALKDIYVTKGIKTTAASKVLENYVGHYDGTVVKKLKDAGVVILGKTNLDAWAHGSSGENSDFGPTKNPYNTDYVPGGSSSGSPTAVAADMALAASGTDTGGSIRLPASFCNVVGLKPTYGRVSRYGVIAMASSLDSIGHFTKTVEDNALYLQASAGGDPMDATTPPVAVPDYSEKLDHGVKGLKIGVPKEYFIEGLDPKVRELTEKALSWYQSQGAKLVEVSLPHTKYAIEVYYIIQTAEVSSNLARYTGVRYGDERSVFGDEAKRRIMLGTYVLSAGYYDAFYKKAMQVRTLLIKDVKDAFEKVDVMITPASPTLPWKLGEKTTDPLSMYLSDIFTVHANLVGIPGLSVPIGFVDGLPVGMQILGPHFKEDLLYQVGNAFEKEHPFWMERPVL